MKVCPTCKKEFDDKENFCGDCGVELKSKPSFCTKCGSQIKAEQKFCPSCGAKIEKQFSDTLIGKTANKIGRMASETAEENISSVKSLAKDAVNTVREIDLNSGQDAINKIKSAPLPVVAIIAVVILFAGYNIYGYYSSPEKQVESVVHKYMKYMLQASEGDFDAIDKMFSLLTPEIQNQINDLKSATGIEQQKKENSTAIKNQYRDKIKMINDQLRIRYGFGFKEIIKDYHIENLQIQGDKARLIIYCDSKANVEATGLTRNNGMTLKKIDGEWYIEHIGGFFLTP